MLGAGCWVLDVGWGMGREGRHHFQAAYREKRYALKDIVGHPDFAVAPVRNAAPFRIISRPH